MCMYIYIYDECSIQQSLDKQILNEAWNWHFEENAMPHHEWKGTNNQTFDKRNCVNFGEKLYPENDENVLIPNCSFGHS